MSSTKQVSINNNSLITKMDGLKDYSLGKFESLKLPKFTIIDFSNVQTFYNQTPIDFLSTFTFNNLKY